MITIEDLKERWFDAYPEVMGISGDKPIQCYAKKDVDECLAGIEAVPRTDNCAEFARLKKELESLRTKLPKWHRCDEPDEDGFVDLPPESGSYFAQYETTWADGVTKRYCEPLEYDADACDWPQLTGHCRVIRWCEKPEPPED